MNDTRRSVLDALDDGPVTGPDLAEQLGVSRAAIWKHVEALREDGFEIASRDDGYELVSVPEFGGPAVEYGLEATFDVEYRESVPSTNAVARDLADDGASDVVVLADEQTGGRGRLDREWSSPSGGVWLSIVLRPDLPPARVPVVTLAAAVAITDAAREAGVDAEIKWPNDVLVGERKLAGILTEMEGEADRVSWVIPGLGINANIDADSLPEGATSIQSEVGPVERRLFAQRLLERFDELRSDPDAVLDAWRERSATLGQDVRVETPDGVVEGEAIDVELPGTLLVETDDGVVRVHAGDCEHLRPV
ncbi:biotin--[acetyl-CoA-carboxylase] ligase [Natronoarchaeum rubrum]|uniref:biotin--[acetyl-CoA-carboxylase] ligase n=1 Tax=Natronoarchaeum rubrum TaxID=755311 RepID=UPI002111B6B4|nr:biotin--[acetyl-CoA-carboxylase] ligase [Natronoarchaeum rubrum]